MGEEFDSWLSAQLDGDGSFFLAGRNFYPHVTMEKAEKNGAVLIRIMQQEGGKITRIPARGAHRQSSLRWCLTGAKAAALARRLEVHLRIKNELARAVGLWCTHMGNFSVSKEGVAHTSLKREQAAQIAGTTVDEISRAAKRRKAIKGWAVIRTEVHNDRAFAQFCSAKTSISRIEGDLSPAYLGGFFDAEGYVRVFPDTRASISQMQPAILNRIREAHGGHVYGDSKQGYKWAASGPTAFHFLRLILPYAFEKEKQVELALSLKEGRRGQVARRKEIEAVMRPLRGAQL